MPKVDHSKNIIELDNVCFAYGKNEVLHNVSLAIHQGDYLGIVGPNGGGKTTVLKIMLGLLHPAFGKVKLFGDESHRFRTWSRIGYVPQKVTNFDSRFPATTLEIVMMGRYAKRGLLKWANREDKVRALAALEKVGMRTFADRLIGDLSGGQQQRVFIARALAADPDVLVLDEPTAGIDEATQTEFYQLLRELNQKHELTLILVSHDSSIIEQEASEIAYVNNTLTYKKNY